MNKRILSGLMIIIAPLLFAGLAQGGATEFYSGKTIRFIVGYAPGGGYDTYTRAIARHIGDTFPEILRPSSKTWKARGAFWQPITCLTKPSPMG